MSTPVSGIGALKLTMIDPAGGVGAGKAAGAGEAAGVGGFGDVLRGKMQQLNDVQADSNKAISDLATGKTDDIAQAMMRIEQSSVSMQLATQLRNKAVEAYQEILRMQI